MAAVALPALTQSRILALRDECLADDIDVTIIDPTSWTEDDCLNYFESGGSALPSEDDLLCRQISTSPLDPLGAAAAATLMPGESSARSLYAPRPEARVRLFCLYGVADVSISCSHWIEAAPPWLEVRLVDYPGHGLRAKEPLPACSIGQQLQLDEAALHEQRAALVQLLTEEILAAADGKPFALFGFSFGALLAYHICIGLQQRSEGEDGGAPKPICLCVAGRGAPHCAAFSRATCELLSRSDDDGMLRWQEGGGQFKTQSIPSAMRPRAACLFRCGMLLGASPAAEGTLDHPLPGAAGEPTSFIVRTEHLNAPPRLAPTCRLVAVGSAADGVWHGDLVARWADVAAREELFCGVTLEEVDHLKLMNHSVTMRACFKEIALAI